MVIFDPIFRFLVLSQISLCAYFRLAHHLPSDQAVQYSLLRSPAYSERVYPPCYLSKLCKGHEFAAPNEYVFAEDDGFRNIAPDVSSVLQNATLRELLGSDVMIKREYSEVRRTAIRDKQLFIPPFPPFLPQGW